MKKTRPVILLTIILLFHFMAITTKAETSGPLVFATGNKKGVYFSTGKTIANKAGEMNIEIEVFESEGSRENLLWLEEGKAQLCIAQGDAVYSAFNGLFPFQKKISNIRAIASLHTEAVHILVRRGLYISQIDKFRGKRISIGPEGSGTESNARSLIEAAGIATSEINLFHLNFDEANAAIEQGRIDIAFFTSGYPNDAVKIITRNTGAFIFEPEPELLERVLSMSPFFVVTTIPARTYSGQDEEITTLGVSALLVVRSDLDPHLGYQLAKIVFDNKSISRDFLPKGIPIRLQQGAYQFFQEKGLYRWKLLELSGLSVFLLAIIGFILWKFKDIAFFFKKHMIARVFALIIGIWIGGSILLYLSEHLVNESYLNPWKAIWSSLINWLNFGSKEPITTTGRVVSVVMIVLGAGCIAWLTAEIASIFIAKKLGGKLMTKHIRNHYIIINWNNKGVGIIGQLRNPELEQQSIIVVTKKKDPPQCISAFKSVHHFHDINIGDSVLQHVNLSEAKAIIILADEALSVDAADAETILILLAIWKLLGSKDRHPKIIAEILQPQRVELAKYAGILEDGSVEIVSSMKLVQNLIAQVAITPGLTRVYDDLLTFGTHSNEIYGLELSKAFAGKTFEEIARRALDLRDKKMHFIPIAVFRNKKTYINPTQKEIDRLEEKDILYAICDDRRSFKKSLKIIADIFNSELK